LNIVWTATALKQRNFIFHYWNERNKSNLYFQKLNSSLKHIEFFCSDIHTGFVGIVEGVSGDGKLASETFEFKVLKTKPFGWEK